MPRRSSKGRSSRKRGKPDLNENAASIVSIVTGQPIATKNPAAVALGRLGGLKGGRARAAHLTPEQRQKIASDAARARWKKERGS